MQILKPTRKLKKRASRSRRGEGSIYQQGGSGPFYYKIPNPAGGAAITGACHTSDYDKALLAKNRKLIEIHEGLRKELFGKWTVGEILDDYDSYLEKEKPGSYRQLKTTLKHLREFFGNHVADDLTTADLDRFRDKRESAGCIFSTANRELGHLLAALRREMRRTPPRISRLPVLRRPSEKSQVREGFIDRKEYTVLLPELPASLRAIFVCAFHTGARVGELKKIRWEQVRWEQNIIELRPKTTKNKEGRWIPIWGDMQDVLQEQKRVRDESCPDSPWVFFWRAGYHARARVGEPVKDFRYAWRKACERAELESLLFHDLRRSAIRFADQDAGISQSLTMMMSGHKTDSVFRRYNIRGGRDASKLAETLNEALKKTRQKSRP